MCITEERKLKMPDDKNKNITPEYIKTEAIDDFEEKILASIESSKKAKFQEYREKYQKSLNYQTSYSPLEFPLTLHIELINKCNLGCQMCYVTNHSGTKHTLDQSLISRLSKEARDNGLAAVIVGLGSEALLFKDVPEVFRQFEAAGVLDKFLYTNGTFLNEKMIEKILDSNITRVHVSIDAASADTFQKIRKKNLYQTVVDNINKLIELRDKRNLKLPLVRVSFCVQKDNKHEVEQFKTQWTNVADRVDFQLLLEAEKHVDELASTGKIVSLEEKVANYEKTPYCALPFNSLSVWADGTITPCCAFQGKNLALGNIKFMTLKEAWDGQKLRDLRGQFLSGDLNNVCRYCIAARDSENFEDIS